MVEIEYVKQLPPAALLEDCFVPILVGQSNGSLLDWALAAESALYACNEDKTALREWSVGDLDAQP